MAFAETRTALVVELPMQQLAGKQVIVPVAIGDQTDLRFMLDTGANGSVINKSTIGRIRSGVRVETAVAASGAGGSIPSAHLAHADRVRIGTRDYWDTVFGVVDLSAAGGIDGVLGQDFFTGNDVELDFAHQRVRILEAGALRGDKSVKQLESIAITIERVSAEGMTQAAWVHADVKVDQASLPAVFDLGADQTIVNTRAAAAAHLGGASSKPKRDLVVGADGGKTEGSTVQATSLRLGSITIDRPKVLVADLPVFGAFGMRDHAGMILGVDQLQGRTVAVSLSDKRIYVSRGASAKPARPE